MSVEAGKRVMIKNDCDEDPRVRGAFGTVFAYARSDSTVWITLEKPLGDVKAVRIKVENMSGAPTNTLVKNQNRRSVFSFKHGRSPL
jgi:hypothetical protein